MAGLQRENIEAEVEAQPNHGRRTILTTETAAPPQVNLDPNAAEKRSLTDVYRVQSSGYEYSSDDYYNKAVAGAQARGQAAPPRQLQWCIKWEALTFRFADNPDTNPIITRSVNGTDKNGAPATWGDPANPEPTADDSFPIQLSKYFAKLGFVVGTDPHVLDGKVFVCEKRELRAGSTHITPLIPVAIGTAPDPSVTPRIVTAKEQGTAGNPAGAPAASTGPTLDDAYKALATAMNGKKSGDMVNVALADSTVSAQSDVLQQVAAGAPAIEKLKEFGSFSPEGVFTATAG
jgi:hypothetical protein